MLRYNDDSVCLSNFYTIVSMGKSIISPSRIHWHRFCVNIRKQEC